MEGRDWTAEAGQHVSDQAAGHMQLQGSDAMLLSYWDAPVDWRRLHSQAAHLDETVAAFDSPYWVDGKPLTRLGFWGVDARSRVAANPSTDESLLALMAADRHIDVRALVAFNPSTPDEVRRQVSEIEDAPISKLHAEAAGGSTDSMFAIGAYYLLSLDVPEVGVNWFVQAADRGHLPAMAALGEWYARQNDFGRAHDWFVKGARTGDAYSMLKAGVFAEELGDLEEGNAWYRKAADAGSVDAEVMLGLTT